MKEFFILEGAYLILAAIILLITLFVTTRPFMKKGAIKKGLISVFIVLTLGITTHFIITKNRMQSVKEAFNSGKEILCENRIYTKGANFVTIQKDNNWTLENNNFKSAHYTRVFFIPRCIVK